MNIDLHQLLGNIFVGLMVIATVVGILVVGCSRAGKED